MTDRDAAVHAASEQEHDGGGGSSSLVCSEAADFWRCAPVALADPSAALLHLQGRLDVLVLEQALSVLLHKHPVLRAAVEFNNSAGSSGFTIKPFAPVFLQAQAVQEAQLAQAAASLASRPFVSTQRLYRFHLFRLARDHHVLLLCCHACIVDRGAMRVLLRSLGEAYNRLRVDAAWQAPLIDTVFLQWQGRTRHRQVAALRWWNQHLAAVIAAADNKACHSSSTDTSSWHLRTLRHLRVRLPPATRAAVEHLCQRQGLTLLSCMLAALKLALFDYNGRRQQTCGFIVEGPALQTAGECVGAFAPVLLTHDNLGRDSCIQALLRQVHQHAAKALLYAMPLAELVRHLQPGQLPDQCWFDVLLVLQQREPLALHFSGLVTRVQSVDHACGACPLTVEVLCAAGCSSWELHVQYAAELFADRDVDVLVNVMQAHLARMTI